MDIKKTDLAYIAGLVDGEGCISASIVNKRHASAISLSITTTYQPVLEFVRAIFEGTG